MILRDWTPADAADAADDAERRAWWRRPDPYADPDWRANPALCEACGRPTERPPVCTGCAEQLAEQEVMFRYE